MQDYLSTDSLGRQEVSAQTDWCLDFKAAQNAQLHHSLQQANEYVKSFEIYLREIESTERLDTEVGQVTDDIMNELRYNLHQTEAECAQLRKENIAVHAELQAGGGRGLRNAFQAEQRAQKDATACVGRSMNDFLAGSFA